MKRWLPLLLSIALHGAAVAFFALRPKPIEPPGPPVQVIELEVRTIEAEPEPEVQQTPEPVVKRVEPVKKKEQPVQRTEREEPATATVEPTPVEPSTPEKKGTPDAPLAVAPAAREGSAPSSRLLPGAWKGPGGQDPYLSSESAGQTTVNGPGSAPDPVAWKEYQEAKTKRRVEADLSGLVADAQRGVSVPAPYFSKLQSAMKKSTEGAVPTLSKKSSGDSVRDAFGTWLDPAEQFGKTGSPVTSKDETRAIDESALGRLAMHPGLQSGDVTDQANLRAGMQQMYFTGKMISGAMRERLRTVVELFQNAQGVLSDTRVLERSGDKEFDEFALHLARKTIREHESDDEPFSSEGWRTTWKFTWEPPRVKAELLRVQKGQGGGLVAPGERVH